MKMMNGDKTFVEYGGDGEDDTYDGDGDGDGDGDDNDDDDVDDGNDGNDGDDNLAITGNTAMLDLSEEQPR